MAKILYFDIETTDLEAGMGHVLCVGYKWEGDKKVTLLSLLDYPGKNLNDDRVLLKAFEKIYLQADLIIYQYGEYFDLPFLRTRLLINNCKPLPTAAQVDTWRICRFKLKFGSNRLDTVAEILGCPYKKTPVKRTQWADARIGDKKAFAYVLDHCKKDILVLEWVYKKIRPVWDKHPKIVEGDPLRICTICGGHMTSLGVRLTELGKYQRLRCKKCGASKKGRKI